MDEFDSRETLERAKQGQEAAEAGERNNRRAALIVSVLAALLAITTLAGNQAATEAILLQARATDAYNEYQANSLKRHINNNSATLLRLLTAGGTQAAAAEKEAQALDAAVASKYRPAQDKLLPEAQHFEAERTSNEQRHRGFQVAEAALQLAIVLSSVSIVARNNLLLWGGVALGAIGVIVAGATHFGLALPGVG